MHFTPSPTNGFERPTVRRTDKPHSPHTGLKVIAQESHGCWQIIVEHHRRGVTVPRDQYSVRMREELTGREEYLTGFPSKTTAINAARRKIDFIHCLRRPRTAQQRRARRGGR
ncbi:MAG: hypothetical protein FJ276_04590 [Planctomycetes bacterium]|nr:hypothetical protein [Planctomycetota bacterium]